MKLLEYLEHGIDRRIEDAAASPEEEALTWYANELTGADDPDLVSAAETLVTKLSEED